MSSVIHSVHIPLGKLHIHLNIIYFMIAINTNSRKKGIWGWISYIRETTGPTA